MIEETILQIEERLRTAQTLTPAQRSELEDLLAELRREARNLPPKALEANPPAADNAHGAIQRLEESLAGFEGSHPQITGLVNRISTILANMGI